MAKKDSRFRKYEFNSKAEAETQIQELLDLEGDLVYHAIVTLGYIQLQEGTYDENDNQLTPPVYSNKYSVDIFWIDEELDGWKGKKIKLNDKKSTHTFLGYEYEDEA